ncbi:MgtC/SapB family protein [Verrucomicrobiaceae bacterium 5K15]|uniref:MgtC/SapB family protein n=1 Tax=Oceaniferula flava TaxID=2800421 RepID=A0AAE2SFW1_9BACT|nr:MgtC/SapB family protein [Oceaniferula flavus]MBK1856119.1 MgtC/SapB family protein [Oceaniferula flavus]MBM1137426.1 MgtC/SapB family protein [Oceaniferula flavus]
MIAWTELQPYLLALALGLLLGLQREAIKGHIAGIRTFPLITLLGAASAALGSWSMAIALGAVAAMLVASSVHPEREDGPGFTTEIACLLAFIIGATLKVGQEPIAILLTGCCMLLLQAKRPLHRFSKNLSMADLQAIAKLTLLSLVILPLLPNESYGPYAAINPFKIWMMVVLIVGLSLLAYFVSKFMGAKKGTLAAGLLGGLISSTATTVSFSRRAKSEEGIPAGLVTCVIMIASTIVFARVLFEIGLVASSHWQKLVYPIIAMMLWMALVSAAVFWRTRKQRQPESQHKPPSDLPAAVVFGLLYAVVLIGVAAANDHLGNQGVYIVAAISGLTDMDAITLSSAQLVAEGKLDAATGWRSILIGGMANLVFKAGIAILLGPKQLIQPLCTAFGVSLVGGIVIVAAWP